MFKILNLMTALGLKSYVSTGSYWQYDHLGKFRFVSPYIKSKNFASMTLKDLAGEKIKVCELVIYDTYCIDDTRGKLLNTLSKLSDKDIFPMTSGCQEICYVNVQDVSRAYYLCVHSFESITNQLAYVKIPLVSNDVRTLRLYIDDFLKHHPSPPQLNWGELKDNPESLRKIWLSDSAEHLMGWKAETDFSRYVPKFF